MYFYRWHLKSHEHTPKCRHLFGNLQLKDQHNRRSLRQEGQPKMQRDSEFEYCINRLEPRRGNEISVQARSETATTFHETTTISKRRVFTFIEYYGTFHIDD